MKKIFLLLFALCATVSLLVFSVCAGCTVEEKNVASQSSVEIPGGWWATKGSALVDGDKSSGTNSTKNASSTYNFIYTAEQNITRVAVTMNGQGYCTASGSSVTEDTYNNYQLTVIVKDKNEKEIWRSSTIDVSSLLDYDVAVSQKGYIVSVQLDGNPYTWGGNYVWEVEIFAKTGDHVYVDSVTKQPTCKEEGVRTYTCECGDTYTEPIEKLTTHTWNDGVVTKQPTATAEGIMTYTCTVCGATKEEPIAIQGHTWDAGTVYPPTCTTRGYTLYHCTDEECTETYQDTFVDMLPHDLDDGTVIQAPTVKSKGVLRKSCKNCSYYEDSEIAKLVFEDLAEKIGLSHVISAVAQDCIDGADPYAMFDGNLDATEQTTSFWSGKNNSTATVIFDKEYVITGAKLYVWSYYDYCSITFYDGANVQVAKFERGNFSNSNNVKVDMNDLLVGKRVQKIVVENWKSNRDVLIGEIDLYGHGCTPTEDATVQKVASCDYGCKEFSCPVCEETAHYMTPPTIAEHTWKKKDVVSPTCTEYGYDFYECNVCGQTEKRDLVNPLGHTYNEVITYPTCKDRGYTTYTCTECEYSYQDLFVDATGMHDYEQISCTEPTCGVAGELVKECSGCHDIQRETLPATGMHAWDLGTVTTEPDCIHDGVKTFSCEVCKQTSTESIPKTGVHTWDEGVITTQPKCVLDGVKTFTCTICEDKKTEAVENLGGHILSLTSITYENGFGAEGTKTFACSRCSETEKHSADKIFICKGYSVSEDGKKIMAGYEIDHDALNRYEQQGTTLSYGALFTAVDFASDGLFYADGTVKNANITSVSVAREYHRFQTEVTVDCDAYPVLAEKELIFGAFVIEKNESKEIVSVSLAQAERKVGAVNGYRTISRSLLVQ